MFTISHDESQNLLTILYRGRVSPDEARQCAEQMRSELRKVQPGFRLLADLTDLEAMDVSCAPHIRSIMEMCNEKGVSDVVRVIPNPSQDIGLQIMSYFHYRGDVRIATCASLDEAMSILSK